MDSTCGAEQAAACDCMACACAGTAPQSASDASAAAAPLAPLTAGAMDDPSSAGGDVAEAATQAIL